MPSLKDLKSYPEIRLAGHIVGNKMGWGGLTLTVYLICFRSCSGRIDYPLFLKT